MTGLTCTIGSFLVDVLIYHDAPTLSSIIGCRQVHRSIHQHLQSSATMLVRETNMQFGLQDVRVPINVTSPVVQIFRAWGTLLV